MSTRTESSQAQIIAAVAARESIATPHAGCLDLIGQSRNIVDVDPSTWQVAAERLQAAGLTYADFLTAYVHGDDLDVLLHVCTASVVDSVLLRTHVTAGDSLPTLTSVYPGVDWHERETAEMFGLTFVGHPNPVHLLLPNDFPGHPLLKSFALNPRVDRVWPGEVEPADPNARARTRRKSLPPGVLADWTLDETQSQVSP